MRLTATVVFLLGLFFTHSVFAQGILTGRVTDEDGQPLPGTNVAVIGQSLGTVTNAEGVYRLSLPLGPHEIQYSYIGFRVERRNVTITREGPVTVDITLVPDLLGTDEVVVVGTRRQDRTILESPVPVDVLGPREIQAQGLTETTQMLQQLVPSYNAPRSSITDGSDHIRPATLRGLGPDQVLILVNGKRRHTSSLVHVNGSVGRGSTGVDLNAIPPSAIERIEVLRDGAAAQYGSDAIAGVINIILKERTGFDAQVSYGQYLSTVERGYTEREGNRPTDTAASFDWDSPTEPGGARIGASEDETYSDGQAVTAHAGYGLDVGSGRLYVSGQFRYNDAANRAGLDPREQYYPGFTGGTFTEQTFDRLNHRYGNGEVKDYSGFANFSMPIGETNAQVYSFGGVSYRDGLSGCFYRRSSDDRTNRSIYPDGFLPKINSKITDASGAVGVKGGVGGWSYDLSETLGTNAFNFDIVDSHNASQSNGQTEFDAGTLSFFQATTNLDLFRAVEIGTASPLSVALGAEFRFENYGIDAGEPNSYLLGNRRVEDGPRMGNATAAGSQCFPGFQPESTQDENRTNVGVYLDLENNLTSQFLVSAAARFENYSDFGSTVTGKLAGRFEFVEGVALRGAVSTGFRAPSLAQAYFTSIATNFINGVPFEVGTFPVTSPTARALGATDLEAEKSFNLSAGLTFQQGPVSLTVDAYQIEIDDRITFTENFVDRANSTVVKDFLAARGINASGGRYFTNALDTRTRGIDVTGRVGAPLGQGTARLTLAANVNNTEVTNATTDPSNKFVRFIEAPPELQALGFRALAGRDRINDYEDAQPDSKVSAQVNYDLQQLGFMARVIRYGEVTSVNSGAPDPTTGINPNDQTFGAKVLTDIEVNYRAPQGVTFAIGANNLFDVYPDKQLKANSFNGIFPYNGFSPFGFFGRFVYTRLAVSL